jgi:hypothetical protein
VGEIPATLSEILQVADLAQRAVSINQKIQTATALGFVAVDENPDLQVPFTVPGSLNTLYVGRRDALIAQAKSIASGW